MDSFTQFCDLFVGRGDAYGTDEGGCSRDLSTDPWCGHWDGTAYMGVYPMVPQASAWMCKWGCVDLDVKREGKRRWDYDTEQDAHVAAVNLRHVLQALGITSWIEVTKSHGRHVWVFAEQWVTCATMRRALLVACEVAGVPPTEVNPKNETQPDAATLGNYVRLPRLGERAPDNRYFVMASGDRMEHCGKLLDAMMAARATQGKLQAAADLYTPPVVGSLGDGWGGQAVDGITPYIRKILEHGPMDGGRDRSGWLYWLVGKCEDENIDPTVAVEVVRLADEAWTHKYVTRKDAESRYEGLVRKVYG